jgi:hypothetical protein
MHRVLKTSCEACTILANAPLHLIRRCDFAVLLSTYPVHEQLEEPLKSLFARSVQQLLIACLVLPVLLAGRVALGEVDVSDLSQQ